MMLTADPGFVGQAYEAPMLLQDAQRLINWYPEVSEDGKSKMPVALLGCPGLLPLISTITGAVRGAWVLPGNTSALIAVSNTVWLVQVTAPATQTFLPQIGATQVGTLLTNQGPVSIADNGLQFGGQGGFAVLTDGQYGYYYALPGTALSVTFTGAVSTGSNAIVVSAIPNGIVASSGGTVTDTSGFIPPGTQLTGANFNTVALNLTANATNNNPTDTITVTFPAFGRIVDAAFLAPGQCVFLEGWLLFNQPGTRTFFTNAATPYTLLFAGSFYALKDSSTDNLITLFENNREIWLFGERTSEVWYNAGGANFAFARIPAVGPQIGCSAAASVTRVGADMVWLARNEQGQNIVVRSVQYSWERISTHGVDHAIAQYTVVSDAIAYAYEEDGHLFYVLTFPTADATWVWDAKTRMWHERLSFNSTTGLYHRHRSNCFMNLADMRIVGDYQSGQLHLMSRSIYTDAGNILRCQRRTPHVWAKASRKRIFYSQLQVEFTPGVGLQIGQGSQPQAMLRWSNDGSFTWSAEHWRSIGAAGLTRRRAIWRRLGQARDRVFELNFSDPVPRDLVGATLFFEPEEEAQAA